MNFLMVALPLLTLAMQLLTNKKVIARTKLLVREINNEDMPGLVKTDRVLDKLKNYFGDIQPIILELGIKIAVITLKKSLGDYNDDLRKDLKTSNTVK